VVAGAVAPRLRGSFMSFNGAVQQLGAGAASLRRGARSSARCRRRADGIRLGRLVRRGAHVWRDRARAAHPRRARRQRGTGVTLRAMIVPSLLDTDLYKFTMMQVVQHHFAEAEVEYRFKCRNADIDLAPFIGEIEDEIRALCDLRFTRDELDYFAAGGSSRATSSTCSASSTSQQRFVSVTRARTSARDRHHDQGAVAAHDPVRGAGARDRVRGVLPQHRADARLRGRAARLAAKIARANAIDSPSSASPTTARAAASRANGTPRCCAR
jgi:hypothetical protein